MFTYIILKLLFTKCFGDIDIMNNSIIYNIHFLVNDISFISFNFKGHTDNNLSISIDFPLLYFLISFNKSSIFVSFLITNGFSLSIPIDKNQS